MRGFRADARGTTAVEFALVATPFFALMMGIMTVGMQYLTLHTLEHAVSEASRQIRTGQAQKAGLTVAGFRQMICDEAGSLVACDSRLVVHFRSGERFRDLVPMPNCVSDGSLTPPSGSGSDSLVTAVGEEDRKVAVNICYDWTTGMHLWRSIWNIISPTPTTGNGKTILSAATVFQTEPYK
ncbi:MAG TPA: pilus assembly protein [Hyphomicrobium sp.]|nr:pilus assembly protein [Hyphomicrobium sp.]